MAGKFQGLLGIFSPLRDGPGCRKTTPAFLSVKTLLLHWLAQSPGLTQTREGFGLCGTETVLTLVSVRSHTGTTLGQASGRPPSAV